MVKKRPLRINIKAQRAGSRGSSKREEPEDASVRSLEDIGERPVSADGNLSNILHNMYHNAPFGEKETAVHLFGIKYAKEIVEERDKGTSVERIVKWAGLRSSLHTEVRKGVKLARYVVVKRIPD